MKKQSPPPHVTENEVSTLRADVKLTGDLFFSGQLSVFGVVTGNIISTENTNSYLILEEGSEVSGEIRADHILAHSTVAGNIYAYQRLSLSPSASINGDVHYHEIEMSAGATVNGSLISLDQPS